MAVLFFVLFLSPFMVVGCGDSGGSGCVDDYDCPEAYICVGEKDSDGDLLGSGQCEPFVCASDADCVEPGIICEQNVCVAGDGQ